jgi:DsbE subfamily thiol:disulfide oxidoreductase
MRRSSLIALMVAAGIVIFGGAWLVVNRADPGSLVGPVAMRSPMPTIDGESLKGAPVSTDALKGKVGVINLWATWCGPCRREQPALTTLATRYGDEVGFMGINYRDDKTAALKWVATEYDVPYPSLFDPSGKTAGSLDYAFLPDTYVVDASGVIRWAIYGETNEEELGGLIDSLLAEGASPSA